MKIGVHWSEFRFVGLVVLVVLILTSLPYAYAASSVPPDKHFVGLILNTPDHGQYMAWYKGFQTSFLISNTLTPEPNPPLFFNLLWFALGRVGYYTGWSFGAVYQLFRCVTGIVFLVMVYVFSALFFPDVLRRRTALLIIAFGSGLGWIWVLLKYTLTRGVLKFPMDVYVAEGNSFLCLMAYPHFAEAASLILAVLGLLLVGEQQGRLRYAVVAGLVAQLLGWHHAYDLLIVWLVPSVYAAATWLVDRQWPRYWFRAMLITGLLSWPPALYSVMLTKLNPIWEEVLAQFPNAGAFTPDPLHVLILMGAPLILALITLVLLQKTGRGAAQALTRRRLLFAGVWLIAGWVLAYVPTDFQIHMLNSWQVPVGLLATIGLYSYMAPLLTRRWGVRRARTIAVLAFVGLVSLTNCYLWMWRFVDLNRYDYPYFLYKDDAIALEWLEDHTPSDAIVLSSYEVGRYVPGMAGRRAFLAHWAQTVGFYDKRDRVSRFFDARTGDTERLSTLRTFGVDYIFHGPAERALGEYDPSQSSLFSVAFSLPRVTIYRVRDNQ